MELDRYEHKISHFRPTYNYNHGTDDGYTPVGFEVYVEDREDTLDEETREDIAHTITENIVVNHTDNLEAYRELEVLVLLITPPDNITVMIGTNGEIPRTVAEELRDMGFQAPEFIIDPQPKRFRHHDVEYGFVFQQQSADNVSQY